ncbi:DUF3857 domain-containing protein [Candidatus Bipolaricaulota bacterium]|nr:DUF3857 domain-containing protein [Candidatus Bipolaricaulota bacterium]
MRLLNLVVVLMVAGLGLSLWAQEPVEEILANAPSPDDYPGMDAVVMLDASYLRMTQTGSEIVIRQRICLLTHEGVKDYGEVQWPYDTELEELHLDYARTITPDGREVVPAPSAIHEVTPPFLQDAPMYSSVKLFTISMPALEPGAIIDWQMTIRDKEGPPEELMPELSTIWYFAWEIPVQRSHLVVEVPEGTSLRWQAKGIDIEPTVQTAPGTIIYEFTKTDIPAITYEPYMPDLRALSPLLVVSTYDSWDEIAAWYADLAEDRYQTSSELLAKVEELTSGIQTPSDKISAIYDFVARDVRYVALEFGLGGWQPHPASEVFANRYGDCKDQATLLITMLRAAGFEAYPVLLRVGDGLDADFGLLPTPHMFNHVIAAVRQGDGWLFLDPTCDLCTADYLPDQDRAKHGLLVVGDGDRPGLQVVTDPFRPGDSFVRSHVQAVLSGEGDLKATASISTGGFDSVWYRSILLSYRPGERRKVFEQLLNYTVPGGRLVSFDHSDLEDTHKPVEITEEFEKDGFAQKAGTVMLFSIPYPAQLPFPDYFADEVGQEARIHPLITWPERVEVHVEITVPEGLKVQLPQGVSVENSVGFFQAEYALTEEGGISASRILQINVAEVSPEDYPLYKELINAMIQDSQAMVVLIP